MRNAIIAISIAAGFLLAGILSAEAQASATDDGSVYGIGYWKNHPDEVAALWDDNWLVFGKEVVSPPPNLVLGGPWYMDYEHAMMLLNYICLYTGANSGSVGYYRLAAQLISAELNILNGANGAEIQGMINAALAVLADINLAGDWFSAEKADKQYALDLMNALDQFNSGK